MSKKASVNKSKKSGRRLKRSVRRTLAAVLMITAIGVAAIPVPENLATSPNIWAKADDVDSDPHKMSDYGYVETGDVIGDDDPNLDVIFLPESKFKADCYINTPTSNLKDAKTDDINEDGEPKDTPNYFASYKIVDDFYDVNQEVRASLNWEFMYYVATVPAGKSSATGGVIFRYNDAYSAIEINLDSFPVTDYYIITKTQFEDFFSKGTLADFPTSLDPTKEIQYQYDDFKDEKSGSTLEDIYYIKDNNINIASFIENYSLAKSSYEDRKREFEKYYVYEKWTKDGRTEEEKLADGMTKPEDDYHPTSQPAALVFRPVDKMTEEDKSRYFCEFSTNKDIKGGELREVHDDRQPSAGSTTAGSGTVFVVYKDGKYVPKTISGRSIVAIGDGAFKGVSNVTSMTIPEKILYIGDEAFANATLMSEIHIMNAHVIGNRAFKGCTSLSTVELGKGTSKIGTECFTNTAISTIEFPQTTELIGYGAFSSCKNLTTVKMNQINVGGYGCEIWDYAFYNCNRLINIEMDNATIGKIGKGVFATPVGGVLESVVLPQNDIMKRADSLGDYLFAGNTTLKSVVFPRSYGIEKWGKIDVIPPAMFHGCINLSYVEFPAKNPSPMYACGYAEFDSNLLFADVADENFYVRGPEKNGTGTVDASPRRCTWTAQTAVSKVVPYVYVDRNGTEYFEMSDGEYLKSVRKDPDGNTGVLTKCTLIPGNAIPTTPNINLPIEAYVGNIKLTGIEEGCFSDNNLNQNVVSLNIYDNSINAIANGVFKDWANLKSVRIGNSVNSIGDEAFAGCKKLNDVTFSSPQIGYDNFTIGRDAFKTGSDKLTFHGDIVEGYAPFDWAMNPDNIIKEPEKIRVCYKSLAPSYLTVMYNPHTGYVTLLDYPKYNQISSILDDVYDMKIKEVKSENKGKWVEEYVKSYESLREYELYREYNSENYDSRRKVFALEWQKIVEGKVPDENAAMKALYESDNYGPWINPEFCDAWDDIKWLGTPDNNDTGSNILTDWLFEPIVAYAADNPIPYFRYGEDPVTQRGGNHYDVINNQEMSGLWRATTGEEGILIEATEKIVVPTGVQSIDVQGFINNKTATGEDSTNKIFDNKYNAQFYLYGYPYEGCWDRETENMYLVDGYKLSGDTDALRSEAGLFSGWYDDKASDEKFKRGNDRVREITLSNVKYLPDYAFDSCERLTTVILGPDCADIGTAPFRGCTALQTVGNNEHYITDNGIVYSVNPDGSYTIEECLPTRGMPGKPGEAEVSLRTDENLAKVSSIKDGAFEDCDKVSFVDLTKTNLTSIPKNCFRGCDGLNRLHLPAAVNSIEEGAFAETTGFTELVIPGKEVFIAGGAFTPRGDSDNTTTFYTSEDSSAKRYVDEYGMRYKLLWEKKDNWRVLFLDADLNQIGDAQIVIDGETAVIPPDPEKEGWVFAGWRGTNNADPGKPIKEDTTFVAVGYSTSNMIDGKFVVEFRDQLDNGKVFNTQLVAPGGSAVEPQPPVHAGYVFDKYGGDAYTNIQKSTTVLAMYKSEAGNGKYIVEFMDQIDGKIFNTQEVEPGGSAIAPQAPIHAGYTFVKYGGDPITNVQKNSIVLAMYSGGTGSGGNAGTTSSGTTTTSTTSTTSNTSNSVSGNSTSSTSTGAGSVGKYTVTVINGSGSGTYDAGSTVIIAANTPATGKVFKNWTTESVGVTFASVSLSATTFVMPNNNVTVTANYVNGTGTGTSLTGTSTNGNTGTGNNGGTRVDITKPGISNKDLATAKVNGSTDNFVVKISETPEATQAVTNALTNKYGNLDSVLYYAMDISLYDSTGTVKISDTTGLTVDITIPIPDALTVFGGNNMAGAVVAGEQLEDLSERFSTINGVPCISFTATHFSPYTIYVNTQQLSDGALDITPKTGDPIHPKWFLSLGLACLSIILFMKKDKKPVKVKAA